jgi:hypothetical protein
MFKNWKTTSAGLVMIIGGIASIYFSKPLDANTITASATAILGGVGLLFAKDNNVTGGTIKQ